MKLTTKILAALLTIGMAVTSQAVPVAITGAISFSGDVDLAGGTVQNATKVNFADGPNARVMSVSGSYSGVPAGALLGQIATFNDFTFSPAFASPVPNLWSFTTLAGVTYTMSADTLSTVDRNLSGELPILNLTGRGTATITGGAIDYAPTEGVWSVSVTEAETTFSFASSTTVAGVPDGGATAALLGLSLLGVAVVSRKLGGASMVKA